MYNDDYNDYDYLDEFIEYDESEGLRDEETDEDEFVEFIPPYGCPHYRQFFPGGGMQPPRPPRPGYQPPRPGYQPPRPPRPGYQPPRPPYGPPGGQQFGPQGGPPQGPPPSYAPSKAQAQSFGAPGGPGVFAIDSGAIRRCMFRYVYIWPRNGRPFWAWLTFVGPRSVAGYRWNGRRWVYFGMDTRSIESFVCR